MPERTAISGVKPLLVVFSAGCLGLALCAVWLPASWWPFAGVTSAERALPLIGCALLIGQWPGRSALPGAAAFVAGALASFWLRDMLFAWSEGNPAAVVHGFYASPIACVLIGSLLILPARLRAIPALVVLPVAGLLVSVGIGFADPTLHDPVFAMVGLPFALWFVVVLSMLVRRIVRPWSLIGARIAGSWMVAIGLLYGATLLTLPVPLSGAAIPPAEPEPGAGLFPGFGTLLPALDRISAGEAP